MCVQSSRRNGLRDLDASACSQAANAVLQQRLSGRRSARIRAVAKAVVFIEAQFRQNLSLQDISDVACLSRFHFSRVFREDIGLSPMQYVRWRRLVEAERRLAAGKDPLMRVATDLGYFDHSHFCRSFRAATGLRPTQFMAQSSAMTRAP